MTQFKTIELPRDAYASARTPLRRYGPPAELLSRMLQQRHQHKTGPALVREAIATGAYADTARAAVRRMPAGYRKTVVV